MTIEDLEKMSVVELKALVYDAMARVENDQKAIQVLNQIIRKKANEKSNEPA